MTKANCWDIKKCGRQPGGAKTREFGVCPAAIETRTDGINGGVNGGRACWALTGTLCGGKVQGIFASKLTNCRECDHYKQVSAEEGAQLVPIRDILKKIQ